MAVEALQSGAQDYLVKGADGHLIVRSIRYAIERFRTQSELMASRRALRSTQMQLLQVEKMDAVGRLASGIAHEVRNPLATIRMGIDFLRTCRASYPPDEEATLDEMNEAVGDAFHIISALLDFCVPSELALAKADLSETIRDGLPMVRHELEKRRIQLILKLADNLPPFLVDRRRIQQVVLNLVLNAMDAMPEGGRLSVSTRAGTVGVTDFADGYTVPDRFKAGQQAVLAEVADSGTGLPEAELERVFDPFYTLKEAGMSTGLGLSVSRNIVELHGGHISLRNRAGGGAAATLFFAV
jgi:signal transduction histidine kinase